MRCGTSASGNSGSKYDGKIYFWDWEQGMKQIAEFDVGVEGPTGRNEQFELACFL